MGQSYFVKNDMTEILTLFQKLNSFLKYIYNHIDIMCCFVLENKYYNIMISI